MNRRQSLLDVFEYLGICLSLDAWEYLRPSDDTSRVGYFSRTLETLHSKLLISPRK